MSKNEITGDPLVSRVATDAFREGHDRIFGKKCDHDWCSDGDPGDNETITFSCCLCGAITEGKQDEQT